MGPNENAKGKTIIQKTTKTASGDVKTIERQRNVLRSFAKGLNLSVGLLVNPKIKPKGLFRSKVPRGRTLRGFAQKGLKIKKQKLQNTIKPYLKKKKKHKR